MLVILAVVVLVLFIMVSSLGVVYMTLLKKEPVHLRQLPTMVLQVLKLGQSLSEQGI